MKPPPNISHVKCKKLQKSLFQLITYVHYFFLFQTDDNKGVSMYFIFQFSGQNKGG
jgi:hypothetical protein